MRRSVSRLLVAGLAGAFVWFGAPPADAQRPAEKKPATPAPPIDVKPIVAKLRSGDEGQVKEALDAARLAGPSGAGAASAVAEALSRGLSLPLTQSAIETLGDLEAEAGASALALYTTHRNVKLRRAAVKSLTRTKGAASGPALEHALSDADPVVRGTAASRLLAGARAHL